jgi:hypothetical protein
MPLCAIQYLRELPKFGEFELFGRLTIPLAAAAQRLARRKKYFFRPTY